MKTKHIHLIMLALVSSLFATSCLKDEFVVDWEKARSITVIELPYISHSMVATNQIPTANYTFKEVMVNCTAAYASDIKTDISVGLAVDAAMVAKYNSDNGLNGTTAARKPYVLMPSAAYTVPGTVTISAGVRESTFDVPINTSLLEPGGKYMIPLKIVSVPAPYIISGNFGILYMRVDMR